MVGEHLGEKLSTGVSKAKQIKQFEKEVKHTKLSDIGK